MGAVTLLDRFLPEFDVREYHEIRVRADPERAYEAVHSADLASSWSVRGLFALRGMLTPWLLLQVRSARLRFGVPELLKFGFVLLGEDPPNEVVLGLAGRFWRPGGGLISVAADEFTGFDEPGFAKAVWNFRVGPDATGTIVSTETRVRCTDDASRRHFRRYWRLVGPFSGYIRTQMLRDIKREAERA